MTIRASFTGVVVCPVPKAAPIPPQAPCLLLAASQVEEAVEVSGQLPELRH